MKMTNLDSKHLKYIYKKYGTDANMSVGWGQGENWICSKIYSITPIVTITTQLVNGKITHIEEKY